MLKFDDHNSRTELACGTDHLDLKNDNRSRVGGGGSFVGPVTTISATSDHLPPAMV